MMKKITFSVNTKKLENDFASDVPFDTVKENIELLLGKVQDMIMNTISLSPYARARVEMVTGNIGKAIDAFENSINQFPQGGDEWCEIIFSLGMFHFQLRDDEKAFAYWKMLVPHTPKSQKQEEMHLLASINIGLYYHNQGEIDKALKIREQIAALPDASSEAKQHVITLARNNISEFYSKFIINPSPFMA